MGEESRSHYRILGVAETASASAVRVAYLNLAMALHPDKLAGSSDAERKLAERRMREVNESYDVLRDPAKRREYDEGRKRRSVAPPPPTPALPDDEDDREEYDDEDDVELTPAVAFLLRRGPLLVVLAIAAFLFIATAYAGGPVDAPLSVTTTTVCQSTGSVVSGQC